MNPVQTTVWMFLTSKDLEDLASKARELEQTARAGGSLQLVDWSCGNNVYVKLVVDQERAREKGLIE